MGSRNLTKQMFIIDMPKIYLEFLAVILFLMFIIFSFKFSNDFNHVLPTIALFSLSAFRVLPSINRIIVGIQKINFSKNSFGTL